MAKNKLVCKYGSKCYRKNPKHLEEYSHGDTDSEEEQPGPPKKKAKIDDFFKLTADDADSGGNSSGYQRQDDSDEENSRETETKPNDSSIAGQSSGYVREEDSEDEVSGEDQAAPESPDNVQESIKGKFLVDMPQDFYDFWDFAKTLNDKNPEDSLMPSLGLQLVGPYDIMAGKHKKRKPKASYLVHWRYYYDPPEFQTVVRGDDKTQFHFGYFRDDPQEPPVFVASNAAKENCTISPRGESIFAAINWFIEEKLKKEKSKDTSLTKLKAKLADAAKSGKYSLEQKTAGMKAREKKVVCRAFHGAGIVVPVDENEVGYRPVPETPANLKKMFKKIVEAETEAERDRATDPLMEIVMYVQFANDECDYGEGLELGMDLFCYGGEVLHKMILNLLPLAYQLLRRPPFMKIIQTHLEHRKHSADLSVL